MGRIKVVDAMCGVGKTHRAIEMMCVDENSRYIFVSPYLSEIERVIDESEDTYGVKFKEPISRDFGDKKISKTADFRRLLQEGVNIATTHVLFEGLGSEEYGLIKKGGYKMVLDEVLQVVKVLSYNMKDFEYMSMMKVMKKSDHDDDLYVCTDEEYAGSISGIKRLLKLAKNNGIHRYGDSNNNFTFIWLFSAELFESLDGVTILTYMFEGQAMEAYLNMNGLEYEKIGCTRENGFGAYTESSQKEVKKLIKILDKPRYNELGRKNSTKYSSSWWKKAGTSEVDLLKSQMRGFFRTGNSKESMWTVFKGGNIGERQEVINGEIITSKVGKNEKKLMGKGYAKGFVSITARATNKYAHKARLAYMANIYVNPIIGNYTTKKGFKIDQDKFALSELIQWVYRSRVRNGEPIEIFIPSIRMRTLLQEWLNK